MYLSLGVEDLGLPASENRHNSQQHLALFTWAGPSPTDEDVASATGKDRYRDDFGEQYNLQACKPIVTALRAALNAAGYPCDDDSPFYEDHGWYIALTIDGQRCEILVQLVFGDNQDEVFVARPILWRSIWDVVLRRKREYRRVVNVLRESLSTIPLVQNMRWISEREFEAGRFS